ncbi:Pre-rRNA-processing protein TSR2-domain-containing protein [Gymnopilus junonius]|uniref:Pre-rRNA-processing protein TSR2-domain-containing protein n=1 Tax=Gymnopilus junonius TaxID=109634 RepID=A0A9P5TRT3_GYMJU|nr:Pre-rRNA-processing protein TSR2-domain-containing protein [Gymnopilus junonius]
MNGSEASTVPPPTSVLFARGVIARLATWDTLRVAVQESWGGPGSSAKRTWLASEIVDAFEQQSPVPDDQYIEEMLLQVIADEFDAIVEDGSGESVAVDIVRLWEETRLGKQDLVTKFEEATEKLKGKKMIVEETEDEEWEDDEDEEGEGDETDENEPPQLIERSLPRNPKPEPEVDEDGFTLVKGKNRR